MAYRFVFITFMEIEICGTLYSEPLIRTIPLFGTLYLDRLCVISTSHLRGKHSKRACVKPNSTNYRKL